MRLAVLGDSDSHSYQDRVSFPEGSPERGGANRHVTLQWTEVLARLRGAHVDQGPWGEWGTRRIVARTLEWFGQPSRLPRKQDYRYNFAVSGARCEELLQGQHRQVPRLLQLMDEQPERWRRGVVVVRIGINDLGRRNVLDQVAREGLSAAVRRKVDDCTAWIAQATALIRRRHPQTMVLLVGLADNTDWTPYLAYWQSPRELANIAAMNDAFDNALRAISRADPSVAFLDDRAWFRRYWGSRDASGKPNYRTVRLPSGLAVGNSEGDGLENAILADGHGGTVLNGLWAKDLVPVLNGMLGTSIPPIDDAELDHFIRGLQMRGK